MQLPRINKTLKSFYGVESMDIEIDNISANLNLADRYIKTPKINLWSKAIYKAYAWEAKFVYQFLLRALKRKNIYLQKIRLYLKY